MKIPIIGEITENKSIAIGVVFALLLLFMLPVLQEDEMTEPFDESSDDGSSVNGSFSAYAHLRTGTDETVWSSSSTDEMTQSILDPLSGEEVTNLVMGVTWTATGRELDWPTMKVTSRFWFWTYQGNGCGKEYKRPLEDVEVLRPAMNMTADVISGGLEFAPANLEAHMPDILTIVFRVPNDEGEMETIIEEYPQRTSEPHPMTFTYKASYWVSVFDLYGNEFTGEYTQTTILDLQWSGSDFEIEWGGEEGTETVTSVAPTMSGLPDYSVPAGELLTLVWSPRDGDNDPATYEVTVDGVGKGVQVWDGGDVTYSAKYALGEHTVVIVVTDDAGNTATDAVDVICFEEIDGIDGVEPTQVTGAESGLETGSTDDVTGAMSLFGGAGEGTLIVFVALALALVIVLRTKSSTFDRMRARLPF